ncbi:MAG: DMT family transporter [Clostridia bacterium]|nr:DMT family transporter [Clostridia bacterium]
MNKTLKKSIGILYILGAALCFALMNLFVNLAGELPLMQKVFFRNALTVVVVFFILLFQKEKFRIKSKDCIPYLLLRAVIGYIGVLLNFYAIDHIGSISDASILNKLSPFFAILFSVFMLKEKPTHMEIIFTLLAFAGAVCVVNPRFDMAVLPAISGFLSGACAGFAYTCVRILGVKGERGVMTVFVFALLSTVVSLPFLIIGYQPMSGLQLCYLLLAGAAATGGQFCITAAYRHAPAKEIAVFDYAQVLFAAILGFLFLSQVPSVLSIIGYVIIIGAAFGNWAYRLTRAKKAEHPYLASEPAPPPETQEKDKKTDDDTES